MGGFATDGFAAEMLEIRRSTAYGFAMNRNMTLVSAIILFLTCDGLASVAAEPVQVGSVFHAPPLRLAEPKWRPLTGQEIKLLISDHTAVIDERYEPYPGVKVNVIYWGGCPPYETFFADGRWEMGMCQVAYRVYNGRWTTEAFRGRERLCVEASDRPKECRFVWQGANADQIVMPLGTPVQDNQLNRDFSPYRLKKR
jgi:hypothetical protein